MFLTGPGQRVGDESEPVQRTASCFLHQTAENHRFFILKHKIKVFDKSHVISCVLDLFIFYSYLMVYVSIDSQV